MSNNSHFAASVSAKVGGWVHLASNAAQYPRYFRNWPTALLNRLNIVNGDREVTYHIRSGPTMLMDRGPIDVRTMSEVLQCRYYELNSDFNIRNGWKVVDLGAHKGMFTVHAAMSGPDTRVLSVEPEMRNFEMLLRNIKLNKLTNVTPLNAAVWTTDGEMELHLGDSWNHSLVWMISIEEQSSASVDTISVANALERAGGVVDLMKIDVEGAEYEVLQSMPHDGLSQVRRIVLEYHAMPGKSVEEGGQEIRAFLERAGFDCLSIPEACLLFATARTGSESDR